MFDIKRKSIEWGGRRLTLETGRMARQADGAVLATYGETMVLATAVFAKSAKPGQDFFPLTVNYQEKFYAAGKIPGSFPRREAAPSQKETLTSRLIDRPIRPLFVKGFKNEVQVAATADAVMMVESEIKELGEEKVLGAVMFAHQNIQPVIDAIIELAEHSAKDPFDFAVDDTDAVKAQAKKLIGADLAAAFKIVAKGERHNAVEAAREKALAALGKSEANPGGID